MKPISKTENPLVIRADFTSQVIWEKICRIIQEPVDGFSAYVDFLNDPAYEGVTEEDLQTQITNGYNHFFIIIADQTTISMIDNPLLIVDLSPGSKGSFRAIPSTIQSIENNLSIANMDFEEFAQAVDENGVFRGFFEA